jgi:GNAT superfamily N-acetyltransferase
LAFRKSTRLLDGGFIVVTHVGRPAACVALAQRSSATAEIKRLYVRKEFRNQGLGSRLIQLVIERARRAGYQRVFLESHISMRAAHNLYVAEGFRIVEAPEEYPPYLRAVVVCMERTVAPVSDRVQTNRDP